MKAQDKTYYDKAMHVIEKAQKEWLMSGFYNAMIIRKSYTTCYTYVVRVVRFLKTIDKPLSEINIDDFTSFLVSLKEFTSSYQITSYHALQAYSKYLAAREVIQKDYMDYIDRPKFFETQETKDRRDSGFLTKAEANEMIENAENNNGFIKSGYKDDAWSHRNKTIIMLLLNTGIRSQALVNLNIDDVNLEDQTISVLEKGSKSRKINISSSMVLELRIWIKERTRLMRGNEKEKALFINSKKERLGYNGVYLIIRNSGASIRGKNTTPHKLRATFGTELYAQSGDLYFVQEQMGHSNPKTTEVYIRGQRKNGSKRAADIMENFFE